MLYFIILASVYVILMGLMIYGWGKWEKPLANPSYQPMVSIVVACRNELANISHLIKDIAAQLYQHDKIELIIVDDHSEDDSVLLAESACRKFLDFPFQVISLGGMSERQGKKEAVKQGVAAATGEIIIATDADCRLPDTWVDAMVQPFFKPYIHFVSGPVVFTRGKWKSRFFHQEFLSLIGIGASALALDFPIMANGANMAFRKQVFDRLNPYDNNAHIPSGDDEFMLRKTNKAYKHSTIFLKDESATVQTDIPPKLGQWVQQRRRWAAKWKRAKSPHEQLPALFVFLLHISLIVMTVLLFMGRVGIEIWSTALLMRAMVEYIFLKQIHEDLAQKFSWPVFVLWQILYPFYALFFGILANFGSYSWKGRKYKLR